MPSKIDAKGLSCPQPVLVTINEIKRIGFGEIEILVDTDTSKENVIRTSENEGWTIKNIQEFEEGYKILISKAQP